MIGRSWRFDNRRDCNRFREMLASEGIETMCKTKGKFIYVWEVL